MKKLFIAASLIIGMIAGAMVLSSFSEPKQGERNESTEITMADGWTRVGEYQGVSKDYKSETFIIWEKEGMCNSYYWTSGCYMGANPDWHWDNDPSNVGALRKNRDGEWYAAYDGKNYFIDF